MCEEKKEVIIMLNIYECIPEVYVNGEWAPCSIWSHTRALDNPTNEENWYYTFADLVQACKDTIINAEVVTAFYNKKPICKISTGWRDFTIRITEKNFQPVGFRWRCKLKNNVTMKYLIDNLPVEDFIAWANEKNISISCYN